MEKRLVPLVFQLLYWVLLSQLFASRVFWLPSWAFEGSSWLWSPIHFWAALIWAELLVSLLFLSFCANMACGAFKNTIILDSSRFPPCPDGTLQSQSKRVLMASIWSCWFSLYPGRELRWLLRKPRRKVLLSKLMRLRLGRWNAV